ncbi:MAG: hypothetical protein GY795_18970 [Desulfobacterales bacterium]|nr:hypothetical protein [Desulfobacterales bacterium]
MKSVLTTLWSVTLFLMISSVGYAGWDSSYQSESYKFTYEVEGEIEIKPDAAVLPLIITVRSVSYSESLKKLRQLLEGFSKNVKTLGEDVFSSTPSDFFKSQDSGRKLNVSFFGGNNDKYRAKLVFNIYVTFKDEHNFWQRAEFMAKANDFVASSEKKFEKNDKISVSSENIYYEISDMERYRGDIIKSVYSKAQEMAKIVAEAEGVKLRVDEVAFDQRINKEVINFSRASLGINARIKFTFDQSPQKSK